MEQLEQCVGHYFGEPDPAFVARARLWALMAWGLGLYAEAAAEFDGDEFDGNEFERLLEDASAPARAVSR